MTGQSERPLSNCPSNMEGNVFMLQMAWKGDGHERHEEETVGRFCLNRGDCKIDSSQQIRSSNWVGRREHSACRHHTLAVAVVLLSMICSHTVLSQPQLPGLSPSRQQLQPESSGQTPLPSVSLTPLPSVSLTPPPSSFPNVPITTHPTSSTRPTATTPTKTPSGQPTAAPYILPTSSPTPAPTLPLQTVLLLPLEMELFDVGYPLDEIAQKSWENVTNMHIVDYYKNNDDVLDVTVLTRFIEDINTTTANAPALKLRYAQKFQYRTGNLQNTAETIATKPFETKRHKTSYLKKLQNIPSTDAFQNVSEMSNVILPLDQDLTSHENRKADNLMMTLFRMESMDIEPMIVWQKMMGSYMTDYWAKSFIRGGNSVIDLTVSTVQVTQNPPLIEPTATPTLAPTLAEATPPTPSPEAGVDGGGVVEGENQGEGGTGGEGVGEETGGGEMNDQNADGESEPHEGAGGEGRRKTFAKKRRQVTQPPPNHLQIMYTQFFDYKTFGEEVNPYVIAMEPFDESEKQGEFLKLLIDTGLPEFSQLKSMTEVVSSTESPTSSPSMLPTFTPSDIPSMVPSVSLFPSAIPSGFPSIEPSAVPGPILGIKRSVAPIVVPIVIAVLVVCGMVGLYIFKTRRDDRRSAATAETVAETKSTSKPGDAAGQILDEKGMFAANTFGVNQGSSTSLVIVGEGVGPLSSSEHETNRSKGTGAKIESAVPQTPADHDKMNLDPDDSKFVIDDTVLMTVTPLNDYMGPPESQI